jgi:hypothetical protein
MSTDVFIVFTHCVFITRQAYSITPTHIKTGLLGDGVVLFGGQAPTFRRNIPRHVPEKCLYMLTNIFSITYQSTLIFMATALRNSYLIIIYRLVPSSSLVLCAYLLLIIAAWLVLLRYELSLIHKTQPHGIIKVPVVARSRRRFSAPRLLRLEVRIPPRAWMFVCCECCVLLGWGLCDGLITSP